MIKLINIEQLDEVCDLIQRVIANLSSDGIDQWDELYPCRGDLEKDLVSGTAYGYFTGGRAASYIVLNEEAEPQYDDVQWKYYSERPLIIHRLSVHPDYRGRGIAREMVNFAENEAARRGYGVIRLDAFSLNPAALRLYEKSGYRRAGDVNFRKGKFFVYEKNTAAVNLENIQLSNL